MIGTESFDFPLWWLFPLIMIVLCFLMMRGKGFLCCHSPDERDDQNSETAREILDKQYAKGEIDRKEYEAKQRDLKRSNELFHQKELSKR